MRQNNAQRTFRPALHSRDLWRAAIVVAILLASALLAYRAPSRPLAFVLLGAGPAVAAAVIYIKRPALGLLALVFAAMLVPFSIGTGTGTTLNPVVLLVPVLTALWFVEMGLRRHAIRFHRHNSVYLLLALLGVVGLSFIVGQLSWFNIPGAGAAAQIGGLMVFVISAAAFLVAAHTLNERWLGRLVYLFIAIGALIIVGRLVPPLGRVLARFVDGSALGSVFWIWVVALPAGLALFHAGLPVRARLALAAMVALTLFNAFFRGGAWASGWAPPLVALLFLIWLRFPRWGWIALFVATIFFIYQFDRFWLLATSNESWLARRQAWQIVLDTVSSNPLLGLGPSNYYFYVQNATIMGWGGAWNVKFSSHNNWVDLIAQTGIIGTMLFALFALSMFRIGMRLYATLPDGFPRAYAAACVAGLIATLISGFLGDWFLPFVYNIGLGGMRASILFWVFLGGLLGLYMNKLAQE
jgi:O-antigen ligase